jgi:hypothetical protein
MNNPSIRKEKIPAKERDARISVVVIPGDFIGTFAIRPKDGVY